MKQEQLQMSAVAYALQRDRRPAVREWVASAYPMPGFERCSTWSGLFWRCATDGLGSR